ncbi:hypothetical protein Oter_2408 [Opitutus terrae PB90-1]|uniref:Uncharacterized protein n=1 Tax=Opitutus terrae (strain DSM 11246 / JCM 15787 / PB90-1) TaxID=452637 RepID=B1ZS91_OPITP|nr:hypothetical protein Oter_2408 [Opitutus terrae PB90-1]
MIFATFDPALAEAWERQLPPGRPALRFDSRRWGPGPAPGFSAVVVLDAAAEHSLPAALASCPTIYVGEPRSVPFEQARLAGRARIYLSYEDSASRLRELLPLLEELAEKQSLVELLTEKARRPEPIRPAPRPTVHDTLELWDFLEGAMESLHDRQRLLAEFRRAARFWLRASHAIFFLREADEFRADREALAFAPDDPLVTYFETHPAVVDGTKWVGPVDAVAELAVRNRMTLWAARLFVPIHDNARLLGLIAFGVRDDGQPYDEADQARGVFFARLLRHCLEQVDQLARLHRLADQARVGAKYLPATLVLGPAEEPPRHVPLIVRELIGQARQTRESCRLPASAGQPFRAAAGLIAETGGVWASWEEASDEVRERVEAQRSARRELLRELALTLSHEIGNALVSLATLRQRPAEPPPPAGLLATVKADIAKLEALNADLERMQALHESDPAPTDLREVADKIGRELGLAVEVAAEPIVLPVFPALVEFALRALIRTVAENRGELGARDLTLRVRGTGAGTALTALFAIKGRPLELEGILPSAADSTVPNQGRLAVFLAKEVLRLHHGEIHAGPGLEGTEILLSLRGV